MNVKPEETSLWAAAFADHHCNTSSQKRARNELLVELRRLDSYVEQLLTKIPEDCKGLTLHDISHVHQLWDVASVLCGPEYPINPLEGFVLGAAFLIHDAGLTAAAYPGGLQGLKASPLYRDLVSNGLKRADPNRTVDTEDIDNAPREVAERALFDLLRLIHAERAAKLLDQTYVHPIIGTSFTLVPPDMLLDLGETIGNVAASHHWDIKRVDRTFSAPVPPPAAYPGWTVDAVKLACILRAADACAIDERRARTMSFIIENPRGISRSHWAFQKFLSPGHLPQSSEALVFRSKQAFPRAEMDAWWVAFDAIAVADRELRACDRLLKRRAGKSDHNQNLPLKAKRVEGAEDAEMLANYVRVDGWRPVDTSARIDDPLAIIESLGGKNLYGDDVSAPLRELLQNAADAVRARRELRGYGPNPGEYPGRIEVIVERLATDSDRWSLTVVDNGVGMPEGVLTGEFLDFGKSLWNSDRLALVLPGLAAKKGFRPTGRFGIGFYAAFTVASDVKVMTKPYRGGDAERLVLHFKNGVKGRAELRAYDQHNDGTWPYGASTVIELKLDNSGWLYRFAGYSAGRSGESGRIRNDDERYWRYFANSLKMLVFALDVEVFLSCPFVSNVSSNKVDIFNVNSEEFISRWNLTFERTRAEERIEPELRTLIDVIGEPSESKSRGCVATSSMSGAGIMHIGGFTVFGTLLNQVQGVVEGFPETTNRRSVKYAERRGAFLAWGERQLKNPDLQKLHPSKLSQALIVLWDLGVGITDHYFLWSLTGEMVFFDKMEFSDSSTIFLAIAPRSDWWEGIGHFSFAMHTGTEVRQSPSFTYVLANGFGYSPLYNRITPAIVGQTVNRTAYEQLLTLIDERGFEAETEGPQKCVIGHYNGPDGGAGILKNPSLKHGDPIEASGVVIRTKPR